jgi:hemerythrin-like metal-binding protein
MPGLVEAFETVVRVYSQLGGQTVMPVQEKVVHDLDGNVCNDVVCTQGKVPVLESVNPCSQANPTADILDQQHLRIKRKLLEFRTAIILDDGMDQLITCSKELFAITLTHFKSEESAMDANKFEGLATHRRFHIEMIESLKEFSSDLEHRRISHAKELMRFFDVRLTYHLKFEDGAFERELRNVK